MGKPSKNVVIVGGGATGTLLARALSKKLDSVKYNVILINDRTYFVHLVATARMVVSDEDTLEDKAIFGYEKLFHNGNGASKIGKAVSIAEDAPGQGGKVVLDNGDKIPYAALVLATGSSWPTVLDLPRKAEDRPGTENAARAHLSHWRAKFDKAHHVVIVGGGAVGIELAGEVRWKHPEKKVTIVHNSKLLLNPTYPDKFRKDLERRLRARKIDVILGDAVEHPTESINGVTTKKGKALPDADLLVEAYGSRPNTDWVASLGDGVLNQRGYVKVNEFLEVPGHQGVFAVGDIIDWPEQKQVAKGAQHVGVVTVNIANFLEGKPLSKKYGGSVEMILVTIGKSGGAGFFDTLRGIALGDFMAKLIKGKGLFVEMARSQRGL